MVNNKIDRQTQFQIAKFPNFILSIQFTIYTCHLTNGNIVFTLNFINELMIKLRNF